MSQSVADTPTANKTIMAIPTTTKEFYWPKLGLNNLAKRESNVIPPKDHEVFVKIHAVSLNYRDIIAGIGQYPGVKENLVPCSDMAGEVIAVGSAVKDWKKGDRVSSNFSLAHTDGDPSKVTQAAALGAPIDGTLTEFKTFPAQALVRIPEHLSYEEASTLPCAAVTAWNALQGPVPLKGGDWVLVQGTGGVSIFALQFAVASGAQVIITSSSNDKLEVVKRLGAAHVINYRETPDWDEEVLKITKGRGVDHVIEVGGPGTLVKSIKSVRMAGYIHNIGFVGGWNGDLTGVTGQLIFSAVVYRSILIGSRKQFEDMNRLIEAHKLKPIVDKVFEFDQAIEALKHLQSQKHIGKVVIRVATD